VSKPRICLNLIVKNETGVLARCFDSIVRFIDCWLIVDTGSTDGTQEFIKRYFADKGIPGQLVERPWRDFAHNRTEALKLAAGMADFIWIIDADEQLQVDPMFELPPLDADAIQLLHRGNLSTTEFYRTQIVRSSLPFYYEGVLHEVITCDVEHRTERISTGIISIGYFDSARNRDPIAKYRADAEVLEKAVAAEPQNARYVFYLAQSYRDSNQTEKAIATYQRRVDMGGWVEEQWYSVLQVALMRERSGQEAQAVFEYLRAFEIRPARAESLCELARFYRERAQYALGHFFAQRAMNIPKPDDLLFIDESVYSWRALDEYSICAFYVKDHDNGRAAVQRLLAEGHVPEDQRARVEKNAEYFGIEVKR
jgi:glycosyltransferase involved in cell wall biosynthesis